MSDPELERFKARRVTAIYRLDLIAKGAQIRYEDGTLVDMAPKRRVWKRSSPTWIAASPGSNWPARRRRAR